MADRMNAMRNTSVQAVERAATILVYLADHPEASLRELAAVAGVSRPTVHRMLNALAKSGLLAPRRDGRPGFGLAVVRLYGAWCRQTELRQVAYPYMLELRDRSGETVSLHVRQGDATVCVECIESKEPIRRSIAPGDVAPILRSSSSKLFLAALPPDELTALLGRLEPDNAAMRARLAAELPLIRQQGYAASYEERIVGAASVAAPIWNGAGELAASLSVAGPLQRVTPAFIAEVAPVLCAVTQAISHQLGYRADAAVGASLSLPSPAGAARQPAPAANGVAPYK
jgi:DNA-binding IclR family transcriptional regulator